MSFIAVAAIGAGVGGAAKIAGGLIGSGKRRREQAAAQKELTMMKSRFESMDTSNPYANLQNTMEDLTVNTQQADFMAQQAQQNQANIMQNMAGAAGGSGIAALAQAMAGQQSQNIQAASASVGQQEAANQAMAAQGAANVQSAQIQGAQNARQAEAAKTETLLGMSQARLGAANEARQQATSAITSGIGDVVGGAAQVAAGGGFGDSGVMGKIQGFLTGG